MRAQKRLLPLHRDLARVRVRRRHHTLVLLRFQCIPESMHSPRRCLSLHLREDRPASGHRNLRHTQVRYRVPDRHRQLRQTSMIRRSGFRRNTLDKIMLTSDLHQPRPLLGFLYPAHATMANRVVATPHFRTLYRHRLRLDRQGRNFIERAHPIDL